MEFVDALFVKVVPDYQPQRDNREEDKEQVETRQMREQFGLRGCVRQKVDQYCQLIDRVDF
jgi:hypothetical protein